MMANMFYAMLLLTLLTSAAVTAVPSIPVTETTAPVTTSTTLAATTSTTTAPSTTVSSTTTAAAVTSPTTTTTAAALVTTTATPTASSSPATTPAPTASPLLTINIIMPASDTPTATNETDNTTTAILQPETTRIISVNPLSSAVNDFSVSLFHRLSQENQQQNVFASPLSISTAMSILLLGARSTSAEDLVNGLKFAQLDSLTGKSVHQLFEDLITRRINNGTSVSLSNYLLIQKELVDNNSKSADKYAKSVQSLYEARVDEVSISNTTNGTKLFDVQHQVNEWVRNRTNNTITSLLDSPPAPDMSVLILNAIYFKGEWEHPFGPLFTEKMAFHKNNINHTSTDFMAKHRKHFMYQEVIMSGKRVQVLELPYKLDSMSMVILLPHLNDSLTSIFSTGSFESEFRAVLANLSSGSLLDRRLLNIYIPKFKLATDYSLIPTLTQMGISKVFDKNEADLSGINGKKDLFVSSIRHKAVVKVDEEGTEAASVTMIDVSRVGDSEPHEEAIEFKADHPFVFLIRDRETGLIYFIGKVEEI